MKTLFTLSLYGATGVYSSAPLSASDALSLYASLAQAGAVVSISPSP